MLQVWIPLHKDLTVAATKSLDHVLLVETTDLLADALAEELEGSASGSWPSLKRVYIDCMLGNAEHVLCRKPQFKKASGQLNVETAINADWLAKQSQLKRPIALFIRIGEALSQAFSAKGMHVLADSVTAYCKNLSPNLIAQIRRKATSPLNPPLQESRLSRSSQLQVRLIMPLKETRGEIWVMLHTGWPHDERRARSVIDSLNALVDRSSLGRCTGHSSSTLSSDVSYQAKNRRDCAVRIARLLDAEHPDVSYIISNDYEILVCPETGGLVAPES